MPVMVSYPGVYIEEIASGVRTIVGVATSIGAFVDFFAQGPMNQATSVLSFADFERQFGGLDTRSEASYAIQQFFLNGGSQAYVVRTTTTTNTPAVGTTPAITPATAAAIAMQENAGGAAVLTATAASPGTWGNNVRIDVDFAATDPAFFNLTVTEVGMVNGQQQVLVTENFRNLVTDPSKPNDAAAIVNAGSQLITLTEASGSVNKRPAMTGSLSKGKPDPTVLAATDTLDVTLGGTKFTTAALGAAPATLAGLASVLQGLIQKADTSLANATVSVIGSASSITWLVVKAGTGKPADFLALGGPIATKLGFDPAKQNVQQYAPGGLAAQAQALPGSPAAQQQGSDGTWDAANDAAGVTAGILGDQNLKTGIWALLDVDLFNILCLPITAGLPDPNAGAVATQAESLCSLRRAMYILDVPQRDANRDKVHAVMTWLDANATLRSKNAALYFPRVDIPDPLNNFRSRPSPPSGTIAGLYARIDGSRGVWKAPAGTEATLTGVQSLEYKLTDGENGVLNPLAINCIRTFPVYGTVNWGARTLAGADQLADDYKYIPVRRLALYIEESLFRGTKWVVFAPNDEPLWSQIRLNVGAFMHDLFRQGAFQGQTPQQAYFVKCDKDTTTQSDINQGIVNVIVGFAPLKPAEFVVIQIQQIAGQVVT
jgi:phage tail sheath protein FI